MKAREIKNADGMDFVQTEVHKTAIEHGWWEGKDLTCIPEKLALIHSEISEALEEYRNGNVENYEVDGKPEGFGIELADAVIRIMDLSAFVGVNLGECIAIKHNYNLGRSYRHGGKLA